MDLNLLVALDALLTDNSVTAAAARLHTSPPAMSRTLARLRRVLDDPILVRAGRTLVPTPRALELRGEVHALLGQARALFTPAPHLDPETVSRSFTLRVSDMILATVTARLLTEVRRSAPGITLRFRQESLDDTPALRDGLVDIEVGVIGMVDPEVRVEPLATSRLVGVVRRAHPLAGTRKVTPQRFAAADHVTISRRGRAHGPIDDQLTELGLSRHVVATVPTYAASLFLARDTDIVCVAPADFGQDMLDALGLHTFEIPLTLPPLTLGMAWHPRNDADSTHRWLRDRIRNLGLSAHRPDH
ncbi:MAG: LysR family transcriptional regulator [Actinomycetota bacterium]|nr:LysR family transcriptional regulator [Actinomycetota bacterium]